MSRGQTWSNDEIRALIDIWSDDYLSHLLVATHKNAQVFRLFSEKMAARGFNRSVHQCRIKVKKLRQQYIKVRESLQKSGGFGEEKEKFIWFNDLDEILGARPTSSPKDVEFKQEDAWPSAPVDPADSPQCSVSQDSDQSRDISSGELPREEESATSLRRPRPEPEKHIWGKVPGSKTRRRKGRTDCECNMRSYLLHMKKMDEADQKRMDEQKAAFENFLKMQQEALKAMQEQHQSNSQMLLDMLGTLTKALTHISPADGMPTTSRMPAYPWPAHDPPAAVTRPHGTASPQEDTQRPVADPHRPPAMPSPGSHLPESSAPGTS